MFRPYGKAGSLLWESGDGQVPFGQCDAKSVETAAKMILTFTEQVEDASLLRGIRRSLEAAERIVFLGFGFHRQNLKILECAALPNTEVIATSFGMSGSDSASVASEIEIGFELSDYHVLDHDYVRLLPMKCAEFMSEVWRTLTSDPLSDPRVEFPSMPEIEMPAFPSFRSR
jgi:hypothetical protein